VRGDSGNVMVINGNIHHAVDVVGRIDNMAALQQKVIFLLCLHWSAGDCHSRNCEQETLHEQNLSA
jgi:hypothetical protein